MSLRILHSIRSVNPTGGGPIEGLKQMSEVNRAQGHSVEVVTMDPPDAPWLKSFPLPVHAMGPVALGLNYGYTSRLVPWLREHRRNYDVVVVNGIWQYQALGVWRALRNTTTPYFVYTHGMLDPWFKRTYPLKHYKKWLYWFWADYRVLRDAAAVLFTCEEERRLARQSFWLYRCDECVVSYGTAGPSGDAAAQKAQFLARYPEVQGKRALLFLGRVHVKKGPDLLLRAFAQILQKEKHPDLERWHLIMAGPDDHEYAREMKHLAASLGLAARVTWTGMVSGDVKWGAFYAAEAFVLASHQENFGVAVTEAMGCGVPVLISDQVNIWREIKMDGAGIIEPDTLAGTENLLRSWLQLTPEEKAHMAKRAQASFRERFHIDYTAESFIRVLRVFGLQNSRMLAKGKVAGENR